MLVFMAVFQRSRNAVWGFVFLLAALFALGGCGGGGSSDQPPPDPRTWTVSAIAGPGGDIGPTSQEVDHGATVELEVTPEAGYSIDTVSGCDGSLDGTTYTTGAITEACTIEASFLPSTYTISATATAGGRIDPNDQVVAHGDTAVFTLERETGFGISRVTGCGGARVGDTYTTAPIVESCAVEAVFGELIFFGTHPINDTGIDWCADAANIYDDGDAAYKTMQCEAVTNAGFPGQDGHHGRDALARAGQLPKIGDGAAGFDFTKIANNGAELPASATLGSGPNDWACTRDNVTGLVWEVKVDNSAHLRHRDHTYTWYDPASPDGNPGMQNGGNCTGGACDTTGFVQAVNSQGLCGSSDWRMPTWQELQGIVNYGRHSPAIDAEYFPNMPTTSMVSFWSGSPAVEHASNYAWFVPFHVGNANVNPRSARNHVRLVHGEQRTSP